jgi:electron-transferring-flavoprotein dehydrogenase
MAEAKKYDVVIVGAGPAGLSAAIKLKQLNPKISVVVVEKGAEVGAHILSGLVLDPIGLDKLLPGWRKDPDCPLKTKVTEDKFYFLGPQGNMRLPNFLTPRLMNNAGNYVGSLGLVCRWLARKAEALGVDIYEGFAASDVLYGENGEVLGVATGAKGLSRDGRRKSSYTPGVELRGGYTLFAEGARGSLTKQVIEKFHLDRGREAQRYGIGIKEIWEVVPENHKPGAVQHTFGWPLPLDTGGGSFLYQMDNNQVAVGFVVYLNYSNPTLSPFDEFQRFKTHPLIAETLAGGKRISYGARAISEGGYQSVPKLTFPGGALIGDSAGFVNLPRIKGTHNAMLSGIFAAQHIAKALGAGRRNDEVIEIERGWRDTAIGDDLKKVRNVKPLWSRRGSAIGVALCAFDMWMIETLGFSLFGTLWHGRQDHVKLERQIDADTLEYPKPDGQLTFDRASSVYLSNIRYDKDQPNNIKLADPTIPIEKNLPRYGEPARLYCPTGVFEVVYEDEAKKTNPRFVINPQNCVHCKVCDIKDPAQNITWTAPEGGSGPNYTNM